MSITEDEQFEDATDTIEDIPIDDTSKMSADGDDSELAKEHENDDN